MLKVQKIGWKFNLLFFLFFISLFIIEFLFTPEDHQPVPIDALYELNEMVAVVFAILVIIFIFLFGSKMIQIFWNLFVSDLLNLRQINFYEALAILQVLGVLTF
jgi:hypothetical protein